MDDIESRAAAQGTVSPTEHICRRIAAMTGAPAALVAAIVLQFVWIGIGPATHWDPCPFVFLLTCSNVIQLILIFVIAVAQRQLCSTTSCAPKRPWRDQSLWPAASLPISMKSDSEIDHQPVQIWR